MLNIILFLVCVVAIFYAGTKLSYYGDHLAEVMGWGKMWMGMILMAAVTSLPELIASISSVQIVGEPDMAVGNIIGSCLFNMLIISLLDMFFPSRPPVTYSGNIGHILSASFGIIMFSVIVFAIIRPGVFGNIGWMGGSSLVFIIIYFLGIRAVYNFGKRPMPDAVKEDEPQSEPKYTRQHVVTRYAFFAVVVVIAALFLPYFGEYVAAQLNISEGAFGTVFLALVTVMPEVIVSVMAVKYGSVDLALGNIMGSTMFNVLILSVNDALYFKGPLLTNISSDLLVPAMGTIIITTISIIGLIYKSKRKWILGIDTFLMVLVYIFMMKVMFSGG